jgi:uncharacterized membrane protein HdeD (DUF308 family)
MLGQPARYWWILVLRGLVGILFGILAFAYPRHTVVALAIIFGAYMIADGVTAVVMASHVDRGSGWLVLSGMAGIAAGLLTFLYPGVTAYVLLYIIAVWAVISGIFEIVGAIEFRRARSDMWLLGLAGVLSITLGILLATAPGRGVIGLVWLLGGYALVFGVLYIIAGFRLKGLQSAQRPSRS